MWPWAASLTGLSGPVSVIWSYKGFQRLLTLSRNFRTISLTTSVWPWAASLTSLSGPVSVICSIRVSKDILLYQGTSGQYLSLHLCGLGQLLSQVGLAQFLSYVVLGCPRITYVIREFQDNISHYICVALGSFPHKSVLPSFCHM